MDNQNACAKNTFSETENVCVIIIIRETIVFSTCIIVCRCCVSLCVVHCYACVVCKNICNSISCSTTE